jgi:hypothetical protein
MIDFGDLEGDRFELGTTRQEAHRGGERAGAERAVGFDHFADASDVAMILRPGLLKRDGVGEGVDEDGATEKMLGDGFVRRFEFNEVDGEADGLRMLVPVIGRGVLSRGTGCQPVMAFF